jgi:hypothetical protein
MALRAIVFIASLFGFRLYTLFGLHILHEHADCATDAEIDVC